MKTETLVYRWRPQSNETSLYGKDSFTFVKFD